MNVDSSLGGAGGYFFIRIILDNMTCVILYVVKDVTYHVDSIFGNMRWIELMTLLCTCFKIQSLWLSTTNSLIRPYQHQEPHLYYCITAVLMLLFFLHN